jgi:hypothetical protein
MADVWAGLLLRIESMGTPRKPPQGRGGANVSVSRLGIFLPISLELWVSVFKQ